MKEYKLPLLNDHYRELLEMLIDDKGNTSFLGTSQILRIRPTYNKIMRNPMAKAILERGNVWELREFAGHIVKGEILADKETFLWYLWDRYAHRGQINFADAAKDNDIIQWNYQELIYWLNGLAIRYSNLISFWSTHGLSVLTFLPQN